MFFISPKKLFSCSRYSKLFFPSFPHFPDSKGQMEVEKNIWLWFARGIGTQADTKVFWAFLICKSTWVNIFCILW